jgi:exonuclease SbcC
MRLKSLHAKNIFQYKEFDQTFDGNLIGIIGPNGSGKSNLIKMIQFAFTGSVPGKNKEQLQRWGAKSDGSVSVTFEHDGVHGEIIRSSGSGKTRLVYGDMKFNGIRAVNDAVFENLGMDKDIAKTVFVAQAELDSVLFDMPSKREQAFQRMCGIGEAAKIHKKIGEFVTSKMPEDVDLETPIASAKGEMAEARTLIASLEDSERSYAVRLENLGDAEALRAKDRTLRSLSAEAGSQQMLYTRLSALAQELENDQAAFDKVNEYTAGISLEVLKGKLEDAERELNKALAYESAERTMQAKAAEREAVGELPYTEDDVKDCEKRLKELSDMNMRTKGRMLAIQSMIQPLRNNSELSGNSCPVCGQEITSLEAVIADLESKASAASAELKDEEVNRLQADFYRMRDELSKFKSASGVLDGQLKSASEEFGKLTAAADSSAALGDQVSKIKELYSSLSGAFEQRAVLEDRLGAKRTQLQALESEIAVAAASTGASSYEECQQKVAQASAEIAAIERALREYQDLSSHLARVRGEKEAHTHRIGVLTKALSDLEERKSKQGVYDSTRRTLLAVKDWMHYANGPHKLSVAIMHELTENVNSFLQRMNAPFFAVSDPEDLAYKCPFNDGRPMPVDQAPDASDLSGGQKVLLAIAFRLASYCMFAHKQGLLSLDEPTSYLDTQNVLNFCTLLERIKEIAESMDLQLFISTHAKEVIPYVDTVINLAEAGHTDYEVN